MTNPTSNFGWQMPTATDLVTNLPADFEVFGQAVDTDFVDLLGGTTGQVLSKTSNADLDFTWVAANPGDITGVTAGVGITGGGTSGTVTVTNDMATTITAAGDIVVGTGSGTYDNLPIGTTNQVLTADTSVSPYKVKWATASAGGMTLLDSGTLSGSSTTSASLSQAYNNLFILVNGFTLNTTQQFGIQPNSVTNLTDSQYHSALSNGAGTAGGNAADDFMNPFAFQNVFGGTVDNVQQYNIYNYANTTYYKGYEATSTCFTSSTVRRMTKTSGWFKSTSAITTIKFVCVGSTTSTGQYLIYGVK